MSGIWPVVALNEEAEHIWANLAECTPDWPERMARLILEGGKILVAIETNEVVKRPLRKDIGVYLVDGVSKIVLCITDEGYSLPTRRNSVMMVDFCTILPSRDRIGFDPLQSTIHAFRDPISCLNILNTNAIPGE